ncbi:MAG: glycosyltransferase family 1 protein [Chloroflexota bacterium]|nr:MAG: glycosyltransferase family 1 protein [Chloroflexota bacterium]
MERQLRVLFLTLGYEPGPVGGAERQARLQAESLAQRGHIVEVVTPRAPGTRSGPISGVAIHRLPRVQGRYLRTITYLPLLAIWLLRHGRRFDIFHIHLANLQADVAAIAGKILRVPRYVKIATGGAKGEIFRMRRVSWATRYVGIRSAARVQVMSDEIAQDVAALDVPAARVIRVPNGLDTSVFRVADAVERSALRRSLNLPTQDVLVLYVGRFARYKGILDLLEAWRSVDETMGATLVVVGEPALDAPAGPLPDTRRTIIRGWTPRVFDYYRACDIYAHPSHADGMPNVVLEAMASGMAVVATKVAAVPSMITDGLTGVLVDIGATDQLASALIGLIQDGPRRTAIADAGAKHVAATYPIEHIVDQIERAYLAILRSPIPAN